MRVGYFTESIHFRSTFLAFVDLDRNHHGVGLS